ncbi:patatin-like phospholipase family protein [Geomonas ferrireducens]|uniref:patatin-like phospholipase family protein n=1 Tax=Geomonas ferrireducens TaxID=2570227 RepID=UPI0013A5E9DE|nr:patatin-like phospholipase family protein [Geomonas ferrireducens]
MKAKTLYRVFLRSGPSRVLWYPRMSIAAGTEVEVLVLGREWPCVRCAGKEGFLDREDLELEPSHDDQFLELPEMLIEELVEIGKGRGVGGWERESPQGGKEKEARLLRVFHRFHDARLAALCLSGGGIRSATFNLGVLQGLARCGVLGEMDYLSTVSGGGYIGSWLTSWISAQNCTPRQRVARVMEELAQESPQARRREPYQVRFLRDYSNYLTPRVGVLSVDTWSIIGTYLRNLLLNWLILIPLFVTFLLLPRFMVLLVGGGWADPGGGLDLLRLAAFFGVIPIAYTVADLPSIGDGKRDRGDFVLFFLAPLLLMACFLSAYWGNGYLSGAVAYPGIMDFAVYAACVHFVGWGAGMAWLWARKDVTMPPMARIVTFCVCAVATGILAGVLGWVAAVRLLPLLPEDIGHRKLAYAVVAVPLVLADYLLTGTVLVALLSRCTGDQDREWWGRAGGITIMAALLWSLLMAAVVYGPWFILPEGAPFWKGLYTAVGGGAGIAAALMGKNSATPALRPGASMDRLRTLLPAVAAVLFLLFLLQGVSLLTTCILRWAGTSSTAALPVDLTTHLGLLLDPPALTLAKVALCSSALGFAMALMVNINTFSMHSMYRNRLVRCYLGASRARLKRCPNPFTGFDGRDDLDLDKVATRPYHVINMAWNLVKGKRLAWQQRKAASFIMSPLFAGSDLIAEDVAKGAKPGGYRRMDAYGAGRSARTSPVTLGTAMAISGAAASPNMGYHSSPLVTFVMALFNVRLGWWLGNPGLGMGGAWRKASPGLALLPLIKETLGLTREDSRDIYLSDGGHFENLALYEMVRRRCRYLIVCDAGCDCEGRFEDLGNAVRKVRADFGIEIEIDLTGMQAKKLHFAVGTVKYSCCDPGAEDGALLYLKPMLTGDEPADLLNYLKTHPEFPHEPTSDQWFDEAQFESYRRLGLHAVNRVSLGDTLDLEHLFACALKQHRHVLGSGDL